MRLALLALLSGLIPMITVNVCFWIAQDLGHVPSCIPYLTGCTSISATGRHIPEALVFRAGMISVAVLLMAYWTFCGKWLIHQSEAGRAWVRAMVALGLTASPFLVLYTVALGLPGELYNSFRRTGVSVYFLCTFVAQTLFALRVAKLSRSGRVSAAGVIPKVKIGLCVSMLALVLISLPVPVLVEDKDSVQNIIEWNFALIVMLFYVATFFLWRATGFEVHVRIKRSDS